MKIIFIENRYTTRMYECVAPFLQECGHSVNWIVQNQVFFPKNCLDGVYMLGYPSRNELEDLEEDKALEKISKCDRLVNYFNFDTKHYKYYRKKIQNILDDVKPGVVFGECTQLHELITIDECRRRNITYLFPTSTRYPPGRLCFLKEDTMECVGGCGEIMPLQDAVAMIKNINGRKLIPSYMIKTSEIKYEKFVRNIIDSIKVSYGWAIGERYLTPSPLKKLKVELQHRRIRKKWSRLANERYSGLRSKPYILYPLQMQPESTIDVWGYPWNDQSKIIESVAIALSKIGWNLVVKPNPKPKYEINKRLYDIVRRSDNVIPLAESVQMSEVFAPANAVLSVTGTVIIECILASKVVFTIGTHAMSRYPSVVALENPNDLVQHLASLSPAIYGDSIALLSELWATSYPVRWIDPFNESKLICEDYGRVLSQQFLDVINSINV